MSRTSTFFFKFLSQKYDSDSTEVFSEASQVHSASNAVCAYPRSDLPNVRVCDSRKQHDLAIQVGGLTSFVHPHLTNIVITPGETVVVGRLCE